MSSTRNSLLFEQIFRWVIFGVIHVAMPVNILCIIWLRFFKKAEYIHYIGMKLSAFTIILEIIAKAVFRDLGFQRWETDTEQHQWIDRLIGLLLIIQLTFGRKLQSIISTRLDQLNVYSSLKLGHRSLGYGVMVFLVVREGLSTSQMNQWVVFVRIGAYLLFLGSYLMVYVSKWGWNFLGVSETSDEQWLKNIIPTDKEVEEKYMTAEEVFQEIKNGSPLLIYKNYIIDATVFRRKHPGSFELITRAIGTNISLVLEGHSKVGDVRHMHSKIAKNLLNGMIVAKLHEDFEIQIPLSMEIKRPYELQKLTLVDREKIGKSVYRLMFKSDKYYYFVGSRDNRLGQHFNINYRSNFEITKRFYTVSNILERFRTVVQNDDPKLDYLRYFKHKRRQKYASYLLSNTTDSEVSYFNDITNKEKALRYAEHIQHNNKGKDILRGFNYSDQQFKELKGDIYPWHNGELIAFVQERQGGWSEFLVSTPLGTEFVGEGLWGTGVNVNFLDDSRIIIFTEGPGLLSYCDMLVMLTEKLDLDKRKELIDQNEEQGEETFMSNLIIDIIVFTDNIDNAYAVGYDLVDYLCSQSEEGRIFKSQLILSDQKEDLHEIFDYTDGHFTECEVILKKYLPNWTNRVIINGSEQFKNKILAVTKSLKYPEVSVHFMD